MLDQWTIKDVIKNTLYPPQKIYIFSKACKPQQISVFNATLKILLFLTDGRRIGVADRLAAAPPAVSSQ